MASYYSEDDSLSNLSSSSSAFSDEGPSRPPPNRSSSSRPTDDDFEAEVYKQLSSEAAAAQSSKQGRTWAQRQLPSAILATAGVLLALFDALSCTTPELAHVLCAYSWVVDSSSSKKDKDITIRIGVFARTADEESEAIMSRNWGGSSSASYVQTWFFCQVILLALVILSWLGVAFAPHPPEERVLLNYRHLIRAGILTLITLTGVSWSLLATLATSQEQTRIGYFLVCGQAVLIFACCFALWMASNLERDEEWLLEHETQADAKHEAKKSEKQKRAEFQKQKAAAITMAKARRDQQKVMAAALGKEGARALLINQMMSGNQMHNKTPGRKARGGASAALASSSMPMGTSMAHPGASGFSGYSAPPQQQFAYPPAHGAFPQPYGFSPYGGAY